METNSFEPLHVQLERRLQNQVQASENLEQGQTAKIFWNRQSCDYSEQCVFQEFKKNQNPRACLYNPKMFKCPAYHYYVMPLLLCEKN